MALWIMSKISQGYYLDELPIHAFNQVMPVLEQVTVLQLVK